MKKILLLIPLLTIGCSSIKLITTDHGQIVNQDYKPIKIVGNPQMICYNSRNEVIAEGYFVRQREDDAFILDDFGAGYIVVKYPVCKIVN